MTVTDGYKYLGKQFIFSYCIAECIEVYRDYNEELFLVFTNKKRNTIFDICASDLEEDIEKGYVSVCGEEDEEII
jgi:predicted DNA-binding protein YlxM (UPF0122 family)